MIQSAPNLRDERKAQTSRRLRDAARELTAERGLSGFTIEELCSEVGVSRRTFFNYFASKENAVIGVPIDADRTALDDAFVGAGPTGLDTILDHLVELQLARWESFDLTREDVALMFRAFEREPRLLQLALRLAGESERGDIALVERREALQPGDLRAATAVQIFSTLVRASMEEMFRPSDELTAAGPDDTAAARDRDAPYDHVDLRAGLRLRLEAARQLLA